MTAAPPRAAAELAPPARQTAAALLLIAGLGVAVSLRVLLGGQSPAASTPAAVGFAAALAAAALVTGWRPEKLRARDLALGSAAAALLVATAVLHSPLPIHPLGPPLDARFAAWAPAVVLVAVSEEWVLRGALFAALRPRGDLVAVIAGAVAFALLHLPMYGPAALPLDLGVGIVLGGLRLVAGGVGAPACAHALADLASWAIP